MQLICLPSPPHPKILHKHCFQFLLGRLQYPGEMKNKGYEILFWGRGGIIGGVQVAYGLFYLLNTGRLVSRPLSVQGILIEALPAITVIIIVITSPGKIFFLITIRSIISELGLRIRGTDTTLSRRL